MIEVPRAALIGAAAALGATLTLAGAGVWALRTGVTVRGFVVRAGSVAPSLGGMALGDVTVEGARGSGVLRSLRVSWNAGKWLVDIPFAEFDRASAAEDEAARESTAASSGTALRLRVGELTLHTELRGEAARVVIHDLVVDREATGALALHARDVSAARSGVTMLVDAVDGARDAQRAWMLRANRVVIDSQDVAQDGQKAALPVEDARDSFDVGADLAATVMLRGQALLAKVLVAIPTARVTVDDVRVDALALLPGAQLRAQGLNLVRDNEGLRLHLDLAGAPASAPEVVDLRVDAGGARAVLDAHGGPLLLPLGATENAEIAAEGHADVDLSSRRVDARGSLRVRGLRVQRPWLGATPFTIDGALGGHLVVDGGGAFRFEEGAFELGRVKPLRGRVSASGDLRSLRVDARGQLEPFVCDDAVASLPGPFRTTVGQLRFEGNKAISATLAANVARPDETVLELRSTGSCTVTSAPKSLAPAAFDDTFMVSVTGADGQARLETFGPGTESWRTLPRISRAFLAAVLTTEDAGFFSHQGVSWGAIRSALVDDLKAKRFVRGGSTITMQLAKNLFLTRGKNLGRKLEEVLLTDYLEDAFGKERILELYANIVELGPDVFGIEAAARHYFGVGAEELSVLEGFWLATLLPNPKERGHARPDGSVSNGKMQELRFLVRKARAHGWLTDEDVADAESGELRLPRRADVVARVPGLGIEAPPKVKAPRAIEGP